MPVITKHNVLDIKNVVFGEGTPKICLPIVDTTKEDIIGTLDSYKDLDYDVVEIRLDFYEGLKEGHLTDVLEEIKKHTDRLVLGTIRTVSEGGEGELTSLEYIHCIKEICDAHVDLVDIELSQGYESVMELVQYAHKKGVHVIMSEHHFEETPSREDMQETLEKMEILGADLPKLAVMPESKEDLLTLLEATLYSSQRLGKPIITMSMGKLGRLSRMMGEYFGSCMTFATAKDASAPGQVPLDDLKKVLEVLHD